MGNRANFVIVKDQDWQLYYSHWGGCRILDALIGGPELALRYAASLRRCEKNDWCDPSWADGGAVVDLDRRRVLFFGEPLMVSMNERRALMDVLATVWPDYEICWAYDGTEELAGYVGASLGPTRWDRQPTLKLARGRNQMCHLISVVDTDGQLRFWPLWWHLSKAWHGPALLDKLPGPGIRRIRLGKIPKAGLTSMCVERRWGPGKPPTRWASFTRYPTCGPGGRPRSGRTASRSTSNGARVLCAFPSWMWSQASTALRREFASGYSRALKTARPGTSPNLRGCWRLSHPGSWSALMP